MANDKNKNAALLFDLDGTLLDTAADLTNAVNYARRELLSLPPLNADQLRPIVARGTTAMVDFASPYSANDPAIETFRRTMLDFYRQHPADATTLFNGMDGLLDYLDQMHRPWGIVTNKLSEFALPIIEKLNLSSRTHCVVCADMVEHPKPAADSLLKAARQLHLGAGQCAYVGDARTDMIAARNAGMLAIAAEWGYLSSDDDVDDWPYALRFRSPIELFRWIKT